MRIAVFGGIGVTGRLLIAQALDECVTAHARPVTGTPVAHGTRPRGIGRSATVSALDRLAKIPTRWGILLAGSVGFESEQPRRGGVRPGL